MVRIVGIIFAKPAYTNLVPTITLFFSCTINSNLLKPSGVIYTACTSSWTARSCRRMGSPYRTWPGGLTRERSTRSTWIVTNFRRTKPNFFSNRQKSNRWTGFKRRYDRMV